MSMTNLAIGIGLGVLLIGAVILLRDRYRDVFAALLVLGIAAVAAIVTISQVGEHRGEQAQASRNTEASPAIPPELPSARSPRPMMRGPTGLTGGAAPPVVEHPYAGGSR